MVTRGCFCGAIQYEVRAAIITSKHTDFPDQIDVTTRTLDYPELVPPRDNTRTSTRLRWVATDELPEYRDERQQG